MRFPHCVAFYKYLHWSKHCYFENATQCGKHMHINGMWQLGLNSSLRNLSKKCLTHKKCKDMTDEAVRNNLKYHSQRVVQNLDNLLGGSMIWASLSCWIWSWVIFCQWHSRSKNGAELKKRSKMTAKCKKCFIFQIESLLLIYSLVAMCCIIKTNAKAKNTK